LIGKKNTEMSGKVALLDSNIIIYISKGELDFLPLFEEYDQIYISIITYMEVLGYHFHNLNEKKKIIDFLSIFDMIWLDEHIVEEVILIRENTRIKLPDAIIAASSKVINGDLITRNIDDFKAISDLNLITPFK